MHYGEVKCCSNFRPGVGVMLGVNAAHFTAMDVGVTLPKMFCWYLARTFTQLCDGDFVSFWRTTTLLLLEVGALQQYFYLSRSLTQRTSFCPPPNSSPLRPLSRVVSSGEDAPSSRNVRPSTHSRRGRRGPGQFPRSASPDATRRFPAGEESDDVESPEGKAPGAGTSDGS